MHYDQQTSKSLFFFIVFVYFLPQLDKKKKKLNSNKKLLTVSYFNLDNNIVQSCKYQIGKITTKIKSKKKWDSKTPSSASIRN